MNITHYQKLLSQIKGGFFYLMNRFPTLCEVHLNLKSTQTTIENMKCEAKVENSVLPSGIYLLKVNNRNTRTRCEICSKLTIKTPDRRQ